MRFVWSDSCECVVKRIVVEVLGNVVCPVSKCVFQGLAGVHEDRFPVRDKVVEGGDDLH